MKIDPWMLNPKPYSSDTQQIIACITVRDAIAKNNPNTSSMNFKPATCERSSVPKFISDNNLISFLNLALAVNCNYMYFCNPYSSANLPLSSTSGVTANATSNKILENVPKIIKYLQR